MKISISTGSSRFETNWKNREITWDSFVKKVKTPTVTNETYAEYMRMSKDKQDAIKDVGGFVGGTITGGRRKLNSCSSRSLVTLDIDYAPIDFFDMVTMLYDNEMLIYSTHKHSPETPRFRLVIPLKRAVLADEHEAIARKIAETIDIELFDPTTFQAERLMYYPSISKDAEFYFRIQKGPWLNPDDILAEYNDWTDTTEWAYSDTARRRIKSGVDKQEDPATKGGLVGVFCRAYGISSAIEKFIPHVYEQTAHEDRWTYKEGSTSGGVIVYDDKWSFSHHSTDPSQGRLCNSFDLVRIHLFGDVDDRVDEATPLNKKPSYGKMIEHIMEDEQVKQLLVTERMDEKMELMKNVVGKQSDEVDWKGKLEVDKKGNILNTIANIVIIIENDDLLKGTLCFDDLRKVPMVKRDLPWRKVTKYSKQLVDSDDAEFRNYLEIMYGITYKDKIKDAIEIVIHKNTFHPVRDYLKGLKWDEKPRVDRLLVDFLGAEDTLYVREVTRKTMVAAVARVFQPGVKFDHVLVLVGSQGLGKSRLVAKLGGEWYSDTFGSLQNKDAMEQIQGVWIMEIGELAGLKKQEVETIKLFISKQEDRFRVAYARRVETFARQCIFIGTTNNDEFLQDATGNRRFWPVKCGNRGKDILQEEIDQIWAECCYWYTMGENLYLEGEVEQLAKNVQEEYTEQDDRKKAIIDYLDLEVPAHWQDMGIYDRQSWINGDRSVAKEEDLKKREWITVPEIWTELFKGQLKDMTKHNVKYIRDIMNKVKGWESKMLNKKPYGHQRGWVRVEMAVSTVTVDLIG